MRTILSPDSLRVTVALPSGCPSLCIEQSMESGSLFSQGEGGMATLWQADSLPLGDELCELGMTGAWRKVRHEREQDAT